MGVAQHEYPTQSQYTHTGPTSNNLGFTWEKSPSHNQQRSWTDSNPGPLDPETETLPVSHRSPLKSVRLAGKIIERKVHANHQTRVKQEKGAFIKMPIFLLKIAQGGKKSAHEIPFIV